MERKKTAKESTEGRSKINWVKILTRLWCCWEGYDGFAFGHNPSTSSRITGWFTSGRHNEGVRCRAVHLSTTALSSWRNAGPIGWWPMCWQLIAGIVESQFQCVLHGNHLSSLRRTDNRHRQRGVCWYTVECWNDTPPDYFKSKQLSITSQEFRLLP